jgi:hypothetical protein
VPAARGLSRTRTYMLDMLRRCSVVHVGRVAGDEHRV